MVAKKPSARDKFGKDQRLSAMAWDERYRSRELGWDMGNAAPPLRRLAPSLNLTGKTILVPGCGRGFEACLFAERGADVTAVDFSPLALEEAVRLAAKKLGPAARRIAWVRADVRKMPAEWTERFDFAVEHACFCALAPADRETYLNELHRVLKPSGRLVGIFYVDFHNPDGPPFGIFQRDLRVLLEKKHFHPLHWESNPPDSWEARKNQEALITAVKEPNRVL